MRTGASRTSLQCEGEKQRPILSYTIPFLITYIAILQLPSYATIHAENVR